MIPESERPKPAEMIRATLPATSLHARAAARSRPRQLLTALPAPRPWRAVPARTSFSHMRPQGLGQDAVGSWLDLASFVALSKSTKTPYDDLATKIGEQSGSPGISRQAPCAAAGGVTWHLACEPPAARRSAAASRNGALRQAHSHRPQARTSSWMWAAGTCTCGTPSWPPAAT